MDTSASTRVRGAGGGADAIRDLLAVGRHTRVVSLASGARRRAQGAEAARVDLLEIEALGCLRRDAHVVALASRALERRSLDADCAARLRLERGHARRRLGAVRQGVAELQAVLDAAQAPLTRARALVYVGLAALRRGDAREAHARFAAFRETMGAGDWPVGHARVLEAEEELAREQQDLDAAAALGTQRLEQVSRLARLDLVAHARRDRGVLLAAQGAWREAERALSLAAHLFRELEDPSEHTLVAREQVYLHLACGALPLARSLAERAAAESRASGSSELLAEALLVQSDLLLLGGEAEASDLKAREALAILKRGEDRKGAGRSHLRRAHALLACGRHSEAAREACATVRLAQGQGAWFETLGVLTLGRVRLRADRGEAAKTFESMTDRGAGALRWLGALGLALARGEGFDGQAVQTALAGLEAWGDRRLLTYALDDVSRFGGRPTIGACGFVPAAVVCESYAPSWVVDAVRALAVDGEWLARWTGALRVFAAAAPWRRVALVGRVAWETTRDLERPRTLREDDPAWRLGGMADARPAGFDLRVDPVARLHPVHACHDLVASVTARVAPDLVLVVDFGPDAGAELRRWTEPVGELARLVALYPPPRGREVPARETEATGLIGESPAMRELSRTLGRVARTEATVHLLGETGTGKEKLAHALHQLSARRQGPFVAVNAASLGDELFESEMFGHVRGAFTGAVADRRGYVTEAQGGTLFIDEVIELSPRAQSKLLRFLQERQFCRVGEPALRAADVRIVTASNLGLDTRVAEGRFRQDLMYRLNTFVLRLPALRDRAGDVRLLFEHFVREEAQRLRCATPALTEMLLQRLESYAWPGNVRELQSAAARLVVFRGDGIALETLLGQREAAMPAAGATLREHLELCEREHVQRALSRHAGNRSIAARSLGITRQGLHTKLRRLAVR